MNLHGVSDPRFCGTCGQRCPESVAFITRLLGTRIQLCPKCAGSLCQSLVRYFAGRKRDGLVRKPAPRNQMLPRRDAWNEPRCRTCEVKLYDWKAGEKPYCEPCGQANSAGSADFSASSPGRC